MAIPTTLERVTYGAPDGAILTGGHRQFIQSVGATRTLKNEESGAVCLFDVATGIVYTLPASPNEGTWFEFATTVTITSGAAKTITAGSKFILGTIFGYTTDATEIDGFTANGTDIVSISSNGSTTGGVIGDRYKLEYNGTVWLITGHVFCGTSTPATPFSTS